MQIIHCDICGRSIALETDIRYINLTRVDKGEDRPVMPEQEVCIFCSEGFRKHVMEVKNDNNVDRADPEGV